MASKTYRLNKPEIDNLYQRVLPISTRETKPQYTYWQLKTEAGTVTAYTSGKVLVQGKDITPIERMFNLKSSSIVANTEAVKYPQAGSDEVGCGDYFGPVVVGACVIPSKEVADLLIQEGIKDSKALSERSIYHLDQLIRRHCVYTIICLKPEKFNEWNREGKNMVEIKCILHKLAWDNLAKKTPLPGVRMIDGFCTEEVFTKYTKGQAVKGITFQTKADSEYISCMAGAIIARAKFLREIDKMEKAWDTTFPRGASEQVDQAGWVFTTENTFVDLNKVAKTSFANTRKIEILRNIHN